MENLVNYSYGSKTISKGNSSIVYQGRDNRMASQEEEGWVAIKKIQHSQLTQTNRILLNNQIQILEALKGSKNILNLRQVFADNQFTYIVTHLYKNDLATVIKKGCINQKHAIYLLTSLISAYQSLVAEGVIHRDIKPANIFLDQNELVLGDFGFAVKQQKLSVQPLICVGSIGYMAPQVINQLKYSHLSDIWAIGVLFYEMLTGVRPYRALTREGILQKIVETPIEAIIPSKLSNKVKQFIQKCLKINPQQRMTPKQLFEFDFSVGCSPLIQISLIQGKKYHEKRDDFDSSSLLPSKQQCYLAPQKSPRCPSSPSSASLDSPRSTLGKRSERKSLISMVQTQLTFCQSLQEIIKLMKSKQESAISLKIQLQGLLEKKCKEIINLSQFQKKSIKLLEGTEEYAQIQRIAQTLQPAQNCHPGYSEKELQETLAQEIKRMYYVLRANSPAQERMLLSCLMKIMFISSLPDSFYSPKASKVIQLLSQLLTGVPPDSVELREQLKRLNIY